MAKRRKAKTGVAGGGIDRADRTDGTDRKDGIDRIDGDLQPAPSIDDDRQDIHDGEWIEERAEKYGVNDTLYQGHKLSEGREWEASKEMRDIFKYLAYIHTWLEKEYDPAIGLGKLEEAGYQFMANKLKGVAAAFLKRVDELENSND